jgi:hypothetical protein
VPKKPNNELPAQPLSPLILDRGELSAQAKLRRDPDIGQSIHLADESDYVVQGWSVVRRGVKSLGISRPKSHNALLEDRFWSLCYKRKIAERTVAGLLSALDACADIFNPAECINYFEACGYDTG